jgi:hypothetical protein
LIGKDAFPTRQLDWSNPNALQGVQRTDQQGVNLALTGVVIVQPPFAMADWPNQSNHASSVQWEGTQNLLPLTAIEPAPEAPIVTSGGSGRRYPYGNLDLETWRRGKRRLKTRIEAVQKQIEQKRRGISLAETEEKIQRLTVQLVVLQKKLLELLAAMDELRKAQDEEENDVMTAYMAYRMLH